MKWKSFLVCGRAQRAKWRWASKIKDVITVVSFTHLWGWWYLWWAGLWVPNRQGRCSSLCIVRRWWRWAALKARSIARTRDVAVPVSADPFLRWCSQWTTRAGETRRSSSAEPAGPSKGTEMINMMILIRASDGPSVNVTTRCASSD